MKARYQALLVMLAFLIVSGLAVAHPCHRDPDYENHRHCTSGPDPDPNPPIPYDLALDSGEFLFSATEVFADPKGTTLNGVETLQLFRPGAGTIERAAWDALFSACQLMPVPVESFRVADAGWSVAVTGDDAGTGLITFRLHNMEVIPTPAARNPDFDLNLTYRKELLDDPFLPMRPGDSSVFTLDSYILWGGAHGGQSCYSKGVKASYQDLTIGSDLVITQ
jgi:hypothetical protein